ncbi:adenylate kinase [Mycetocola reblochoni]|uniref:Adenylate kinase n=2 Tax=Mycetocola reblochoni TaxID=331618 RepID=A0A1R4IBT6_9MICO|nr:adenylate kinase [Mycetocola reblochoni]RLP69162.1 adenylate kinase [Mycetocola reblochoni]SJN17199.1 Adenylate kinase [Mycetocola reblochoni REB411]
MTTTPAGTRLLIVGPPGAGKGTQAARIAERYGIPAISTGDIFRANIAGGTELGQRIQEITSAGNLVPDSLTNEIVADRLGQDDAVGGFLLDGYPRTVDQVRALDEVLAASGAALDAVVLLTADTDEVVARLLKRAADSGRADDTEDVIRYRQDVYREQTEPIVAVYRDRGLVVEVDGMGSIDEVSQAIAAALDERSLTPRSV